MKGATEKRPHMENLKAEQEAFCLKNKRLLSRREYEAMRVNLACIAASGAMLDALGKRIRECMPVGFWRDANLSRAIWKKLFDALLLTIPVEKLQVIKSEAPRYELYTRLSGAASYDNDGSDFVMIPRQTLKDLAEYAGSVNCGLCMKKGKAARKCRLRRILSDTFPFNAPQVIGESEECIFTGYSFERQGSWEGLEELTDDEIIGSDEG